MNRIINLYSRFFRISAMTFGGGYAMMPMVEKELVEKDKLLTHQDILDDYAMGQTLPGVIGVNSSALMGYRVARRAGLIAAVLGFITPSILIISIISSILLKVEDIELVDNIFNGLRAGVVALMLNSLVNISRKTLKSQLCHLLFIASFIGVVFIKLHPIILIASGGLISLLNIYIIKGNDE